MKNQRARVRVMSHMRRMKSIIRGLRGGLKLGLGLPGVGNAIVSFSLRLETSGERKLLIFSHTLIYADANGMTFMQASFLFYLLQILFINIIIQDDHINSMFELT